MLVTDQAFIKEQLEKNKEMNDHGLSQKEAEERLAEYGTNELVHTNKHSAIMMFLSQFKDFIVLVLLAATLISFFLGETADAITITIIIVVNALLGFIQEYRTEKSLEALKELSAPHAVVLRDGRQRDIPAHEVVPGDLLIIEAGDRIAADGVLVEAVNVQINESILTGESTPVEKTAVLRGGRYVHSIEKDHLLYMGTTMVAGRAKLFVTETGMNTEMGHIANMIQEATEDDTPLQKRLTLIGKELVLISLGACILVGLAGIYHGQSVYSMFLAAVSLAVAAIPEGLPAIVTVALALGVQRMLRRNALIRKLPAVETLGSTTVICSDKTGTLTENKMTVKKVMAGDQLMEVTGNGYNPEGSFIHQSSAIFASKHEPLKMMLTIGALCNNAQYRNGDILGDPTEGAILIASYKGGIFGSVVSQYTRLTEIPFDSDRKCMSVICKDHKNNHYVFVKGAPDRILDLCTHRMDSQGLSLLSVQSRRRIMETNEGMADEALRVLAFAYKKLDTMPHSLGSRDIENRLTFVGLEGMIDPPRPEAAAAIKSCYRAGIKPVMITGDYKTTAVAIARELGLMRGESTVLMGEEIERMNDEELRRQVAHTSVFARVTPRHKLRIVGAYKKRGNVVAMTGDGVNDAPALKEADIGIAMGKTGTDVAKEASSMILLDDNFATIVAAVEEGRIIYDNIRKFIRYLLSCNLGEIIMMAAASFMGMPMPLVPIQILWVNLVTDGLPALALGVDPPEKGIMDRPARKGDEGIFSRGLGSQILLSGVMIGASSLAAFAMVRHLSGGDLEKARTAAFATLIVAELIYSFESRSEHKSIFELGFFSNPHLVAATFSSFVLMLMVTYIPFLSAIFKTVPLGWYDWCIIFGFSFVEFSVNTLVPHGKS